jgi:transcriptional regulator with XRE-family HTH domain
MKFNEKIKFMRKSKDLTQEQMAEYLGVSPQAVSRWECGVTSPDISTLPQIAQLFNISVDELLGVDQTEKQREITSVINDTEKDIDQSITEEPIIKLRAALLKYPNNDRLLCSLMYGLYAASENEELCKKYDEEIISIAHWIKQYSFDDYCRNESHRLLFRHYCDTNRKSEALQLVNLMPSSEHCREGNIYWLLEGNEKLEHLRERISIDLRDLSWSIWAYSTHAEISDTEKNELENLRGSIEKQIKGKFTISHYWHAVTGEQ